MVIAISTFPAAKAEVEQYVERGLHNHIEQEDIDRGAFSLSDLVHHGHNVFVARFTVADGFGRPMATGDSKPTKRNPGAPAVIRTSGPDSNSCAGCHNQPSPGGSGDSVANAFVLAQFRDPVTTSVSSQESNERNTPGLMGSGAIELLAREMTRDLLAVKKQVLKAAAGAGHDIEVPLTAKGVSFGRLIGRPDGTVDARHIEGIDPDLVIKPFSFKGVVISLREFTINAMNHHHGMQAIERFGWPRTGQQDFDEDGVSEELTIGDITAITLFQAALSIPTRKPATEAESAALAAGEHTFSRTGCAKCHIPELHLESAIFSEPNPHNRPGNLRPEHVASTFDFDLRYEGFGNRLEPLGEDGAVVRAFTDLKRHRICDDQDPFFCNERLRQDNVATDMFLTTPLWHVGSSSPYGHRGNLTTLREAILHHSGEARAARNAFDALSIADQGAVLQFLASLVVESTSALDSRENGAGGKGVR